jgi:hypothetical protein
MEAVEAYKVLGPLAVGVLWTGLLTIMVRWPRQRHRSLSVHAAASRHAFLVMAAARTISTPLFFLFMAGWLVPYLDLPKSYLMIVALMSLCDLVSAWTPDSKGWVSRLHKTMAYTVAFLMLPITAGVLFSPRVSAAGRGVAIAALSYMALAWVLFIFVRKSLNYYLYFQAACILLFQLALLAAAYL